MRIFREAAAFIRDTASNHYLLTELVKRDFRSKYAGTYLGMVWAVLQPLLFMMVLNFVFAFGFRAGGQVGIPFTVYLFCGLAAWLYFVENLNRMTAAIRQHSFLVKKVNVRLSILPVVTLLSSVPQHIVLVIIVVTVAYFNGLPPTVYLLQIPYYFFAMFCLLLGVGWFTSSVNIFMRDMGNIVTVISQFGFWMTPIFWQMESMPEWVQRILKLNPMYYIVTGYRDSVAYHVPFWEHPGQMGYFWGLTAFFMLAGAVVFRRLRPHFADVL